MAQKHIGSKKACVLWCVWFALLMSAPYAPGTGSMATIGWGAVSTSKVFAYVAAGIVMGLWWGTLPRRRAHDGGLAGSACGRRHCGMAPVGSRFGGDLDEPCARIVLRARIRHVVGGWLF